MTSANRSSRSWIAMAFGIAGTFLIVAVLVLLMRRYAPPPAVDQARVAERTKALAELRATEAEALTSYGWVDQGKGVVRLPVQVAMQTVVRNWQNPDAARSNLLERVAKATAVPPPPPQQPSEFE